MGKTSYWLDEGWITPSWSIWLNLWRTIFSLSVDNQGAQATTGCTVVRIRCVKVCLAGWLACGSWVSEWYSFRIAWKRFLGTGVDNVMGCDVKKPLECSDVLKLKAGWNVSENQSIGSLTSATMKSHGNVRCRPKVSVMDRLKISCECLRSLWVGGMRVTLAPVSTRKLQTSEVVSVIKIGNSLFGQWHLLPLMTGLNVFWVRTLGVCSS